MIGFLFFVILIGQALIGKIIEQLTLILTNNKSENDILLTDAFNSMLVSSAISKDDRD